jgi:hypothetical protein
MSNFIYRILSLFFGPSDAATARHFNEQAKQRAEPFLSPFSAPYGAKPIVADDLHKVVADTIGDQITTRLSHKWTTSTGLKDYEAFQPAKPSFPTAGKKGVVDEVCKAYEINRKTKPIPAPATSKKQAILNYIKLRSPKGVTAENVGRAFPAWRYSTISARISELYKAGTIVSVGVANTSAGSLASIFAVAE